jgi:hypothetical protein
MVKILSTSLWTRLTEGITFAVCRNAQGAPGDHGRPEKSGVDVGNGRAYKRGPFGLAW